MNTITHEEQLIAQAQAIEPTLWLNGNKVWIFGDYTLTHRFVLDRYDVRHTPITYLLTPPASDWTHTSTIADMYIFKVYPLPTGGEVRVPVNDAAIEAYEAGKAEDGLYAWEWLLQWEAEQEVTA